MKTLRVLLVEDSEDDALLLELELRRGGYAPSVERVETPSALRAALAREGWDVVISDYALPAMNGLDALRIVRESPEELPFVLVSGTIGEESAVEALKQGAGDFVVKQNLSRLVHAVEREMEDARTRREKRETVHALREAVAARDAFLSIASHELKTPLTALQLQVQGLIRAVQAGGAGTDRVSERIRVVARSTERLGELVNRLLDVSRITADGEIALERERFDLAELARDVARRFADAAADAGSTLVVDAPSPVPGDWDRARVDAALTNLVSNAVKYGEGRPIAIEVRAEGSLARLVVRDAGIGIDAADQQRIFERFERAVPEKHYGGFGLGLWVVRSIAEQHGGRIVVESVRGRGSSFTLELPREAKP
jgi:signal transduction histidine kinase